MFELKLKTRNYLIRKKLRKNQEKVSSQVTDKKNLSSFFALFSKILFLSILGVIILFPLFMMISISLMNDKEAQDLKTHFILLPDFQPGKTTNIKGENLENQEWVKVVQRTYSRAFSKEYWGALGLTSLNVLVSVVLKVFVTFLMGYAFAIRNWRGKNVVFTMALALLVLPEVALLSGQLRVVKTLKLNATYVGFLFTIAIPFVASVFNALMYKNAFEAIPGRIKEVSLVDGATGFKYLWKVAMPMVVPTTLTVIILTALASWNAYLWPLTIVKDNSTVNVLSVWLFKAGISTEHTEGTTDVEVSQNVRMAASIIVIIPMFLVYFIFRTRIMNAISRQGSTIKG